MAPDKREPGRVARANATTYSITGTDCNTAPTATEASGFGVMLDRELTTTGTCAGADCWCHVGSSVAWPVSHLDEMARLGRELRALEIQHGVLG